jgi:hypothetical protein
MNLVLPSIMFFIADSFLAREKEEKKQEEEEEKIPH